jgi:Transposase DDE domain
MDTEIIIIYGLSDDYFKEINHQEDSQCQMSDAEIVTTAIVAARYFSGNYAVAQRFLSKPTYIGGMLSRSRFSRRLHRLKPHLLTLMAILATMWKELNVDQIYIVDSFPIPVCDNYRISRCRIYQEKQFRGYQASKRRYFYGLKLHMMVTANGQPVEFFLTPGAFNDTSELPWFDFDLPDGAIILGDKAYNLYWLEDVLADLGLKLTPIRKENSKRPLEPWQYGLNALFRKRVETTGSLLERLLPKHIHATSASSFELKVVLFVFAVSLDQLISLLK